MSNHSADQIILAHPEFLSKGEVTIFGLIMDRSGSMRQRDDVPRTAINEHIKTLKTHPNADSALGFVMTFADDARFDIPPQPLKGMPFMPEYESDGNTFLYGTTLQALKEMLSLKAKWETRGVKVNLILAVFTDGEDSFNSTECIDELVKTTAQALEAQAQLVLVGIGHPAKEIARVMGFPPQDAVQIAGTPQAVRQSMTGFTQQTYRTMTGIRSVPSTPVPPSSH